MREQTSSASNWTPDGSLLRLIWNRLLCVLYSVCAGVVLGVNASSCEGAGQCTHTPDDMGTAGSNEEACTGTIHQRCMEATLDGTRESCTHVIPEAVVQNFAALDLQLTGDAAMCPGRTVFQNPPGQCPFRMCQPDEIRDCDGICLADHNCKLPSWGLSACSQWGTRFSVGDGYCANGVEQSAEGYRPNFNCPFHGCEGGDCGLDPFGQGTPCGVDFNETKLVDPDADLTASCDETAQPVRNLTLLGHIIDASFTYNRTDSNGRACAAAGSGIRDSLPYAGACAYTAENQALNISEACTASAAILCPGVDLNSSTPEVACESAGLCVYTEDDPASVELDEESCVAIDIDACAAVPLGVPNSTQILGNPSQSSAGGILFDGEGDGITVAQSQWGSTGSFTVAFWMNKHSTFTSNNFEYMFSQNAIASRFTNIQVIIEQQQYLKVTMVGDNAARLAFRFLADVLFFDRWQHVAIVTGFRGSSVYLGGISVPLDRMMIVSGNLQTVLGSFTMDTDLYLGSRTDRHPNRNYAGAMSNVLVYQASLSASQVGCVFQSRWDVMVAESCYLKYIEIDAEDAGVINADGSQSFCGPSVTGKTLWHRFEGLVSGVDYTITVASVNEIGPSALADMRFAARTAIMQVVPLLIERSVTKPFLLEVESMLVNLGDGRLHWNVAGVDFAGNVTVSPMFGTVEADGVGVLRISVASVGLAPLLHHVVVMLSSNAANRPGRENVTVGMLLDSHAVATFSVAEGAALRRVTRGATGLQVTIRAIDADDQVAVAGGDPFEFRLDAMPSFGPTGAALGRRLQGNASMSANQTQATEWSTWFPSSTPMRRATVIAFGAGVYRAEYDAPESPGHFLTSITLRGVHIKGSPFQTHSVCGKGEYDDEGLAAAKQRQAAVGSSSTTATDHGAPTPGLRSDAVVLDGICSPCDTGMVACEHSGMLLSDIRHVTGVWRSSVDSPHFHWCDNAQCNAGVGPTCGEGYGGTLCKSCAPNYGQIASSCLGCPPVWLSALLAVGINLLPLFTLRYWLKDHLVSRERYRSQLGAIDKISFNFIQTAGLIPAYQTTFPPMLEGLFAVQRALTSFGSGSRLFFSCALAQQPEQSFLHATLLSMALPLGLVLLLGCVMLYHRRILRYDLLNQELLTTLLLLYIAFPAILQLTVSSFSCEIVDPGTTAMLRAEPAVVCDSVHQPAFWVTSMGALAGLAIPAIPLLCLLPVWRARRANTLAEETVIWRYGWLYMEYEYVMWELVVMLRKGLLAIIPALLAQSSPQSRYLFATCLFFFAILAHALLLPYSQSYAVTAQCELVSLLCNFAIFACCFFSEGMAAAAESGNAAAAAATGATTTNGASVAIALITFFALGFFQAMHRLVSILEGDGARSGPIAWADIQVYCCYSLIPRRGARAVKAMRYEVRTKELRGPPSLAEHKIAERPSTVGTVRDVPDASDTGSELKALDIEPEADLSGGAAQKPARKKKFASNANNN